ncbi:MAG: hypothetical protein JWN56_781 [Sphingobacteriales bacterium]|nr:hypothetical protein [Sphingobacteriales bacterium]
MGKTILITGGSGLVGRTLTRQLLQAGYTVHLLSRSDEPHGNPKIKRFKWNLNTCAIDERCIENVESVIHLAGEGIADKRWTKSRKKSIIESRTKSISMIYDLLKKAKDHQVKSIISASAIGYYGSRGDELLNEESVPSSDFLSQSCLLWEKAVSEGVHLGLRVAKLRIGIILCEKGGALEEIAKPIKAGIGSPLGSGEQWVSWIHIKDVARIFVHVLENESLDGVFNVVSPNPVTNKQLTDEVAKQLNKTLWAPHVPAFVLKLLLGEMSEVVLSSTKASSEKIQSTGFQFDFPDLKQALRNIYS